MPDIFVSYKKEEHEIASLLATRLTEAGYDVWWDDALLAGERFEDEISEVLDASRLVVVLWSRQSVKSDWVKAEAETARQQKKALPVIIDDMSAVGMPLLYRGMHAARFSGWTGDTNHPGYVELLGSIRDRLGRATGPQLSETQAEAKLEKSAVEARQILEHAPRKRRSPFLWLGLLFVALIALGGGGYFAYTQITALSPEDKAALTRCDQWSTSPKIDWLTGFPRLDMNTASDCETAVARLPDNGNFLGILAMVRIAQGPSSYGDALSLANRGIQKNGSAAYYALGSMYARGLGVPLDLASAATNIKQSMQLGSLRAAGRLCMMAIDGNMALPISSTREDLSLICKRAVEGNDSLGQLATGFAFETGIDGRIVNPEAAADYYRRAADQGDDEAAVRLGILYSRGVGVNADPARAVSLFQQAATNNNPAGQRSLAITLELGAGIPRDINRAAQLYERASIGADVPAMLLAGYYGVPQNLTPRQYVDVNLVASSTSETGSRMRGELLALGITRQRDTAAAETEFKKCADIGNSMCEVLLGYFYQSGMKGTADLPAGAALYEKAAASGNLFGQYYLAYALETGAGTAQDTDRAMEYYRLAAAQGHLSSINRLAQLGQVTP